MSRDPLALFFMALFRGRSTLSAAVADFATIADLSVFVY